VGDNAELGQVAPQRIDEHRSLPDHKIADAVGDERRLLLRALDRPKRIEGRRTASQTASASAASCLLRFTQGLTQPGGISRTSCPNAAISRAQKCAVAHASIPTRQGRQGSKKGCDLGTAQAPAHNNFSGRVNPVQLENMLRNVDTDGNPTHGWLPLLVTFDDHHLGTELP
jgi:hypothetical protein